MTTGQELACRLRGTTADQKAALAVELMRGDAAISALTKRQAVAVTGARASHL
jgi:hypothetical protein